MSADLLGPTRGLVDRHPRHCTCRVGGHAITGGPHLIAVAGVLISAAVHRVGLGDELFDLFAVPRGFGLLGAGALRVVSAFGPMLSAGVVNLFSSGPGRLRGQLVDVETVGRQFGGNVGPVLGSDLGEPSPAVCGGIHR